MNDISTPHDRALGFLAAVHNLEQVDADRNCFRVQLDDAKQEIQKQKEAETALQKQLSEAQEREAALRVAKEETTHALSVATRDRDSLRLCLAQEVESKVSNHEKYTEECKANVALKDRIRGLEARINATDLMVRDLKNNLALMTDSRDRLLVEFGCVTEDRDQLARKLDRLEAQQSKKPHDTIQNYLQWFAARGIPVMFNMFQPLGSATVFRVNANESDNAIEAFENAKQAVMRHGDAYSREDCWE